MACSVNIFSCVQDINRVLSALSEQTSKGEKDDDPTKSEDGWESHTDTWDWNDDSDTVSPLWLQDCCISLSPANDNLAIAKDDKAVFLSSKWDKYENVAPKNKYEISWSGSLAVEEGEHITDVLCIPVASQHRSSQGSPDWTCIVAGFSSGYMRIYLQNGSLIFSQLLHEDKVIRLKCRTWEPHRDYGNSEHVEELAILYPTALVIIDGFSLYQSLRACRNQLAKAQASGLFDHANPPPLAYKKWRFDGQKQILDIASCGVVTPNLFDQLQTASFIGGYNATIRGSAPAMSHYVTSGADPFIGVYSAIEGSSPPLISDVAIAVASKLTSAVLSRLSAAGGWLGWGSTPTQTTEANKPTKPKVEKGTKLPARYGLPDYRRLGNSINLSPNGKLAVTTDEFGRVLLLDIKKGIAVRMWKGYRDAECGWVIVDEDHDHDGDSHSHQAHRTALFLVIYAAKRGILEIWRTEQGPRVAAFNVGKDCRLLYAGHGILGVGHVYRQSQSPPQHTLNCTLIHGDGTLKTFAVPFHTALSDKHSKRMRDLHLLKKLTSFLENIKSDDQDDCNQTVENADKQLQDILVDIQTPQLQRRGLQCILGTVGLPGSVMLKSVNVIIEGIDKRDTISPGIEEREDDHEDTESLLKFCRIQKNLLQTHASLVEILQNDNDSMIGDDETQKNQNLALAQLLGVTKSEATDIVDLLDDHLKSQPEKSITSNVEASSAELTVNLFLGCFEASSTDQQRQQSVDKEEPSSSCSSSADYVCLKKALSTEMKLRLANFIFKKALSNQSCTESLRLPLDSSGINPLHLMDLLVSLWLSSTSQPCNDIKSLFPLHSIVSIISSIAGSEFVDGLESEPDDSSVSPWWEHVRQTLAQSTSIATALSLAAVCRSVALGMSTAAKKVQSMEAESKALAVGDWISISVEIERWNLLIFQLDDVITIKTFVNRLPLVLGCQPCVMVKNENTNGNGTRNVELSVVGLLSGGVGASARVVAHYLALYDVPPELLGQPRKMEVKQVEVSEEEEAETGDDDRPDEIEVEVVDEKRLEGLDKLQAKFPHSLHQDILWASCALECVAQWSYEKEKTNKLFLAIDHIKCIHCLGLKHGVASILWKKHFREKISALVFLMEKVGKAPKDRLCRKTVDIGYSSLVEFLRAAKVILELISKIEMSDAEVLVLRSEDFWHTGKSNRKSLIEDALDQPTSNVPLVELHIVLVTIMWIIMALDMKSVRPLSLFDSTTKGAFAKDLSTSPPLSGSLNESILQARNKFLTRALSMYVTSMATVDGSADRQSNKETSDWSIVTLWVAEQLDVDVDSLRRHFVCELYSAGLDNYGSEALLSVREKQSVGPSLLVIVGQRLAHTLSESESSKSVNQLSRLPTHISRWIKHQEPSKLSCRSVPLLQTNELLSIVLTLLPNDSSDFTLASNLSEAFKSLLH